MDDFKTIKNVLDRFNVQEDRYISREFQKYAYDLAIELGDELHMGIYMRMVKNTPRHIIEKARYFVKDASNVQNPGRLFLWKIKKLKEEIKEKDAKK
jgi:hypothetical protein